MLRVGTLSSTVSGARPNAATADTLSTTMVSHCPAVGVRRLCAGTAPRGATARCAKVEGLCSANGTIFGLGKKGALRGNRRATESQLSGDSSKDSGAFGKVHLIKQSEKHFGPHAEWFWDVKRAGGGALFDLGSHGIGFSYWFLGRPRILSAYSHLGTYVHGDKTKLDDEAISIIEFEGNAISVIENSWARRGGMDDRIEIYGEGGLTIANLQMGNALPTYSEYGFGYAVEKAPTTKGWSWPVFQELWNYGFPQEMHHFASAIRGLEAPLVTGEDGKVVLEAIYAGYASAGLGQKVSLPYKPTAERPVDEWLNRRKA